MELTFKYNKCTAKSAQKIKTTEDFSCERLPASFEVSGDWRAVLANKCWGCALYTGGSYGDGTMFMDFVTRETVMIYM